MIRRMAGQSRRHDAMARPLRLTARFMTKLEPGLLRRLDAWCVVAGMNRSAVVRLAIERLLRSKPRPEDG